MKKTKLMQGDNIESLKKLPDNSIDSVVTDPPYGISFMNRKWDYDVPSVEFWKEVYRVLKPGGHILSFGGTRTYHRMVVNIEDAGFEIRDQIQWIYGSGFPKSHNIGKAVDKLEGNEREVVGKLENYQDKRSGKDGNPAMMEIVKPRIDIDVTKGTSPYEGWGTALKPANEPICVARKPLSEKSVAENVLKWGTGGINVDGCRVDLNGDDTSRKQTDIKGEVYNWANHKGKIGSMDDKWKEGRFPANIILECICDIREESEGHENPNCPCRLLDEQSGESKSSPNKWQGDNNAAIYGKYEKGIRQSTFSDKGGASRFFYQAKVSKQERNMGLDGFEDKIIEGRDEGQDERNVAYKPRPVSQKNTHPTVKPINLMAYLCRLITPSNGIVLDPFCGSGSTGIAAQLEGFRFVGMEMDPDYFKIAESRINSYEEYKKFKK
jgi:site-specific DNA-methyltransferase (adenine-specific)